MKPMKICRVCKLEKPIFDFGVNKHIKSGINSMCKACGAEKARLYRIAHPECIYKSNHSEAGKAKMKRYQQKNKELLAEKHRKWYAKNRLAVLAALKVNEHDKGVKRQYRLKNKESINKRISAWQKANPEKGRAKTARYRSAKYGAIVGWANDFFIGEAYSLASLRTKVTGIKWSVDHIVPLQNPIVCGLHCEDNLRVITAIENSAKRNYHWPDMPEVNHA